MKNKFYASLVIGVGLAVTAMPSEAKSAQHPVKKQAASSAKPAKSNTNKTVSSAKNKPQKSTTAVKQKTAAKTPQHADAKIAKHDKNKTPHHADAKDKDSKHSKKLASAKDKDLKHGKNKAQHYADARNTKHSRKLANGKHAKHGKHQDVIDERYEEEEEEEDTAATEEEMQTSDEANSTDTLNANQTDAEAQAEQSINEPYSGTPVIPAPHTLPPVAIQSIPNEDNRIHSLIGNNAPANTALSTQETPLENNNLQIEQHVHDTIANRNSNTLINNNTGSETTSHVASAHGVVDASLNASAEKAGLSGDMLIQLTDIFAWDIDFANNLQEGDQFTVIYENADMGNASNNRIVAAQFINRGKVYTAIRYKDKEGVVSYYTPDGRSLRKAFLTTPIDYARVSSHFDPHRRHPILNRIRAHKGVDYAARTGTPVKAAGDGVVTFHGNRGAYGRMIVLAHGEHYETAYAHLSNFRADLQDGEPVKQGDVIGYVGQSGLATGPHLHYEFRVDGVHHDPENLDSKQAMRLAHDEWEDFHAQTIPVLTQLNQAKAGTLFAKNP